MESEKEIISSGGGYNFEQKKYEVPDEVEALINASRNISIIAERILKQLNKKQLIHSFNKDDVPKKYQEDVFDYFKRLSEKGNNE